MNKSVYLTHKPATLYYNPSLIIKKSSICSTYRCCQLTNYLLPPVSPQHSRLLMDKCENGCRLVARWLLMLPVWKSDLKKKERERNDYVVLKYSPSRLEFYLYTSTMLPTQVSALYLLWAVWAGLQLIDSSLIVSSICLRTFVISFFFYFILFNYSSIHPNPLPAPLSWGWRWLWAVTKKNKLQTK